jgi:hypothetical protein
VSDSAVTRWLSQFAPGHVGFVKKLLDHFKYYSVGRVKHAQAITHRTLVGELGTSIQSTLYVPIGYLTSGGASAVYLYCSDHGVSLDRLVTKSALSTLDRADVSAVVFLDDYIGTGRQVELLWESLASEVAALTESVPLFVEATVATTDALKKLSTRTGFRVLVAEVLEERHNAFSENSTVFPDPSERAEAMDVLRHYGERLNPEAPLGYAAPQNLLGFFYSTLSNTLPIFWSTEGGWVPLLPHKQSLINSGRNMRSTPRYTIPGPSADPEVVNLLIQEYRQTDAVLRLLPALSSLGFSRQMIGHVIEYVRRIKHLAHEARPVRVSLLFGNSSTLRAPSSFLRYGTAPRVRLDTHERVIALAQLVDGLAGALTIDLAGDTGELFAFDEQGDDVPFVPSRWQAPAKASARVSGLLLTSDGSGRMSVFYEGQRLLTHRGATWHVQPPTLSDDAAALARSHRLPEALVRRVLELAIELSDRGDGAMLTVGASDAVLKLADPVSEGKFDIQPTALVDVPNCLLMGPMRQDGASIITDDGTLVGAMRFLRPSADVAIMPAADWGARHTTAAKVSAATGCLVLTVSSDGAVTALSRGRVALKLTV